jgi:hypothetical protein
MMAATGAHAQSGGNNGNNNWGSGNGNGNGNGSDNVLVSSSGSNAVNFRSRRNTPSVVAPGLAAAGIESCLGSASIGGSGPGFGLTIAGTTTDKGCNLRLFSRTLSSLGYREAATQILCNDPQVAEALSVQGVQCYVGAAAQAARVTAATLPVSGQDAPVATGGACQHYDFFRGCLDAAVVPAAGTATVAHREHRAARHAHRTTARR